MRYIAPLLVALSACATLPETELAGQWDGAVRIDELGQTLRVEFHFAEKAGGYSAYLVSVDQGGGTVQADSIELTGNNLTVAFNSIGAVYTGALEDESLSGNWVQDAFGVHIEAPLDLTKVNHNEISNTN